LTRKRVQILLLREKNAQIEMAGFKKMDALAEKYSQLPI